MKTPQAIQNFLETCHLIQQKGMVSGSGGNLSMRCDDGIMITPSGRSLESLREEDIVVLQEDGSYSCSTDCIPSKEWRMHLACYQRPDVQALIHVHSTNAVAVSCLKNVNVTCAIPVYTPGYCIRVGNLPVLPYMKPGSIELSQEVARVIEYRNSVLLANHGSLAVGHSLEEALNIVEEIEDEAKLYFVLGENGAALTEQQQEKLPPRGMRT